jgi:hypothetical protein
MRLPEPTPSTPASDTPAENVVSDFLNSSVMSEASVKAMGGVLGYWERERERGSRLARVALDILTAPGKFCTFLPNLSSLK